MSIPVRTPESRPSTNPWQRRVDSGDWDAITAEVNEYGGTLLPQLLTDAETASIRSLYQDDQHSAQRSTWAGTASGRASTATSRSRTRSRWSGSSRHCTPGCCRSPGTGTRNSAAPPRPVAGHAG
jgi:hypothetical protein